MEASCLFHMPSYQELCHQKFRFSADRKFVVFKLGFSLLCKFFNKKFDHICINLLTNFVPKYFHPWVDTCVIGVYKEPEPFTNICWFSSVHTNHLHIYRFKVQVKFFPQGHSSMFILEPRPHKPGSHHTTAPKPHQLETPKTEINTPTLKHP